jgi:hypothetical protein
VVPATTIASTVYNGFVNDVETDLNQPRPIIAGGTGATNATTALYNVSGEKATQVVTNWDSQVWVPGSFYAASSATGASPVAGHAFAGQCYIGESLANPPTNQNVVLEARDLDYPTPPGPLYVRQKKAGVWSSWTGGGGTAAPFDAMAYSGMQINGSMEVSQSTGGAGFDAAGYACDGWKALKTGTMVITAAQTLTSVGFFPGFTNCIASTVTTAQASLGAGDYTIFMQPIEGWRLARLAWGTAGAQPITIGFWTAHHRTGLYSGSVRQPSGTRSYTFTYTQAVADVPQYNTVTVPGDTAGTWPADNSAGALLAFSAGSGTTFTASSANTWLAGNFSTAPGQVNAVAATSDVFRLTGVVVVPGLDAPVAARSALIMRPYDQELATCKRYWQKLGGNNAQDIFIDGYQSAGQALIQTLTFLAEMRAIPTTAIIGTWTVGNGTLSINGVGTKTLALQIIATATAATFAYTTNSTCYISADARL